MLDASKLGNVVIDYPIVIITLIRLSVKDVVVLILVHKSFVKSLDDVMPFMHLTQVILVHFEATSICNDLTWQIVISNIFATSLIIFNVLLLANFSQWHLFNINWNRRSLTFDEAVVNIVFVARPV